MIPGLKSILIPTCPTWTVRRSALCHRAQRCTTISVLFSEDLYMHSRYMGYTMWIKSTAFIPCVMGFITFFTLIGIYGRISKDSADSLGSTNKLKGLGEVGQSTEKLEEQPQEVWKMYMRIRICIKRNLFPCNKSAYRYILYSKHFCLAVLKPTCCSYSVEVVVRQLHYVSVIFVLCQYA